MKKILLLSFFLLLITFSEARVLNAIAIVVDGEPITTEEIKAVQKQLHVSKKEAQDMLIENRLQKGAMRGIKVSEERGKNCPVPRQDDPFAVNLSIYFQAGETDNLTY